MCHIASLKTSWRVHSQGKMSQGGETSVLLCGNLPRKHRWSEAVVALPLHWKRKHPILIFPVCPDQTNLVDEVWELCAITKTSQVRLLTLLSHCCCAFPKMDSTRWKRCREYFSIRTNNDGVLLHCKQCVAVARCSFSWWGELSALHKARFLSLMDENEFLNINRSLSLQYWYKPKAWKKKQQLHGVSIKIVHMLHVLFRKHVRLCLSKPATEEKITVRFDWCLRKKVLQQNWTFYCVLPLKQMKMNFFCFETVQRSSIKVRTANKREVGTFSSERMIWCAYCMHFQVCFIKAINCQPFPHALCPIRMGGRGWTCAWAAGKERERPGGSLGVGRELLLLQRTDPASSTQLKLGCRSRAAAAGDAANSLSHRPNFVIAQRDSVENARTFNRAGSERQKRKKINCANMTTEWERRRWWNKLENRITQLVSWRRKG